LEVWGFNAPKGGNAVLTEPDLSTA